MNIGRAIGIGVLAIVAAAVALAVVLSPDAPPGSPGGRPVAGQHGNLNQTATGTRCGRDPLAAKRYFGVITQKFPYSLTRWRQFTKLTHQHPNIAPYFIPFGMKFDSAMACRVIRLGALPLIQINARHVSLEQIVSGHYRPYLHDFAAAVKKFRLKVALSFGHEMNGNWYSWGNTHTPASVFVRAWRTIHHAFTAVGARNVIWVWTINREGPGAAAARHWWPGAKYVNWVGVDGHLIWPHDTFGRVFGPTIASVRRLTRDPIIVAETAVAPSPYRPAQLTRLFSDVYSTPGVLGFVWFNIDARYKWHLEGHRAAIAAFRRAAARYPT